jgi:hypothetical protein
VFLYFSGHGGRIRTGPHAGHYLLPVETLHPEDADLARTALPGDEFTRFLNGLPARKVVVVFDCCHAAGVGRAKTFSAEPLETALSEDYYEVLRSGTGRVIFASSRSTESSYVLPGANYGLFTQHLHEGLRGGVASEDGHVRVFDLFEYLQPRVVRDSTSRQHPVFKADLEDNFAIALYRGGQRGSVPKDAEGFRYDAYISFVDREPDATWVWKTLLPRLKGAGLNVAVSEDVEEPGVERVVNVERGIRQSKRTVVVLSDNYLADNMAHFENVLGQTMGIQEGTYRLLPVKAAALDERRVPTRLSMLTTLDLTHPHRAEQNAERLIKALKGPLPRR